MGEMEQNEEREDSFEGVRARDEKEKKEELESRFDEVRALSEKKNQEGNGEAPAVVPVAPGGAGEGGALGAAAEQRTPPPYTKDDNVAGGLPCYICGNKYTGFTWYTLMQHVRRHGVLSADMQGSWLLEKGTAEQSVHQKQRRKDKPAREDEQMKATEENKRDEKGTAEQSVNQKQRRKDKPAREDEQMKATEENKRDLEAPALTDDAAGGAAPAKKKRRHLEAPVVKQEEAALAQKGGATHWRTMLAWVRCSAAGKPATPLDARLSRPECPAEGTIWKQKGVDDVFSSTHPSEAEGEDIEGDDVSSGGEAAAPAEREGVAVKDECRVLACMARLEAAAARLEAGRGDWTAALPKVLVKSEYLDCKPPPAFAENPAGNRVWPMRSFKLYQKKLKQNKALAAFKSHLGTDKNNCDATIKDHVLAMQRIFHMLEVDGKAVFEEEVAANPVVMVALYMGEEYKKILGLKLLNAQYSWTRKLLEGLIVYAKWQKQIVLKALLKDSSGHWDKHAAAIEQFVTLIQGGYTKRVHHEKLKRREAKKLEDLVRIRGLPPRDAIQVGVRRAMLLLSYIERTTRHLKVLPEGTQAEANACLVGILFCDGFAGRCQEWEIMLFKDVEAAFAEGRDWLRCSTHKTSNTYGDLAKWLAPGAVEAIKCYMRLPRRPDVQELIVPPRAGTKHAGVPRALWSFAQKHLPTGYTKPTVNLLRKFFHTYLTEMTRTEDKLLEVLKVIDAHSVAVARKHYVLRDPAVDAKLAEQLVKLALGKTVPWPGATELEDYGVKEGGTLALPNAGLSFSDGKEEYVEEESDDENDILIYWNGGECFGIKQPLLAIADAPEAPILALKDEHPRAAAASASRAKKEAKKDKKDKKAKKDKGAKKDKKKKEKMKKEEASATEDEEIKKEEAPAAEEAEGRLAAAPPRRASRKGLAQLAPLSMRRSQFDPPAKKWAEEQHEARLRELVANWGWDPYKPSNKEWFNELHALGVERNIISPHTSPDTIRSHIRRVLDAKKAAEAAGGAKVEKVSVDVD